MNTLSPSVERGEEGGEEMDVFIAMRAIWVLYKRQKWTLLAELGLRKETHATQFLAAEMLMHRSSPNVPGEPIELRRLTQPRQVAVLMSTCEGVTDAAIKLLSLYMYAARHPVKDCA